MTGGKGETAGKKLCSQLKSRVTKPGFSAFQGGLISWTRPALGTRLGHLTKAWGK
jgi:hypothetical protein